MKLTYSSSKLRKQCTQEKVMRQAFDDQMCKKLKMRLKELETARVVADVLVGPGRWEFMRGDRRGTVSGRLSANDRIIVEPLCNGGVIEVDDEADWTAEARAATEVRVVEIVDYH